MKRPDQSHIIVITGAESTGKSLLARRLGQHFNCPVYPEYAREYLEAGGPGYSYGDVVKIARKQQAQMREALRSDAGYVFFDTWLVITKVWFEVVYGKVPGWVMKSLAGTPVDLFLLCANDIPWQPDPLRENGGEMRRVLFEKYRENLILFGYRFQVVEGSGEERFRNALQIIRENL